jgi:hypothetical protein
VGDAGAILLSIDVLFEGVELFAGMVLFNGAVLFSWIGLFTIEELFI